MHWRHELLAVRTHGPTATKLWLALAGLLVLMLLAATVLA
jgi:hypothetical protein